MTREFTLSLDGTTYKIAMNGNSVLVNGQPFVVTLDGNRVLVDGSPYEVTLQGNQAIVGGIAYNVAVEGLNNKGVARHVSAAAGGKGAVTAIMPGKIIRVLVARGDEVAEGQVLCVLEAMKMENEVRTPKAGRVKTLSVRPGLDVERGALLAEIE